MVEGDRIYGEGINIAARLFSSSPTRAVCCICFPVGPGAAQARVEQEDLGDQTLKTYPSPSVSIRSARPEEAARPKRDSAEFRRAPWARVYCKVRPFCDRRTYCVDRLRGDRVRDSLYDRPFALYYYAAYGPSLNVLHRSPWTSWLTDFLLPHFSYTVGVPS